MVLIPSNDHCTLNCNSLMNCSVGSVDKQKLEPERVRNWKEVTDFGITIATR